MAGRVGERNQRPRYVCKTWIFPSPLPAVTGNFVGLEELSKQATGCGLCEPGTTSIPTEVPKASPSSLRKVRMPSLLLGETFPVHSIECQGKPSSLKSVSLVFNGRCTQGM